MPAVKNKPKVIEDLTEEEAYLWAILSDPSGLDQAEFLWVDEEKEHDLPNEDGVTGAEDSPGSFCFRAWPFQWSWYRCTDQQQVDQMARSVGKALDVSTPVPTPGGWKTMGDLVAGDEVFNEDGIPVKVKMAFEPIKNRPCYEIVFDSGEHIVADAEHLWSTWDKNERRKRKRTPNINRAPTAKTTEAIKETLRVRGENNHSISVAKAFELPDVDLVLSPYVLGYWLGDGTKGCAHLTVGDFDREEVVALVEAEGVSTRRIPSRDEVVSLYPDVGKKLSGLGVLGNKHIPMQYLRASRVQRLELLQGLMDSDGHCRLSGRCEITQKSKPLAEGIFELLISLGQKPFWEKRRAVCNGKDCGPVYRINFRPINLQVFRIKRKAERVKPTDGYRCSERHIWEVIPVVSRTVRCIEVDSPGHQFLVGRSAIPTHNSQSIQLRACAFPFIHPGHGQEMVICAPELNHLEPITDLIETRLGSTRLYQALLKGGRSGITHRPLKINFKNGARIMGRIPQKTGAGMKGIHPVWLEMDEAQDFPKPGWVEIYETLKRGNPNSVWRVHGVTRGVHDNFWTITQPGEGWTVHRAIAMNRPDPYWNDAERQAKILLYHGEENSDYKRNILGEHGDENSPIFSLHRLMACVDDEPGSAYNEDEYCHYEIYDSWLRQTGRSILEEIDLPYSHTEKYKRFWVGMDFGWINHPSEILIFAEETLSKEEYKYQKSHLVVGRRKAVPPTQETPRLKLVCRITMWQVATPDQEATIMKVIQHYKPVAFSCDATGGGWPSFQNIQRQMEQPELAFIKTIIKGYNFSGNILIDLDKTITVSEWATKEDIIKETGIKRNTVDHATDILRILIDSGRFWLPWEKDLLDEFQGQTYKVKADINQIGRREYSLGKFHALDAARMAALGWQQYGIEEFVKHDDQKPVFDVFLGS